MYRKQHSYLLLAFIFVMMISCNSKSSSADNAAYHDPAIQKITDEIKEKPDNAKLYFKRGLALRIIEQDSLALTDFKKAISLDSSKAEYFSAVGDVLFEHKDINGSVKWFAKALQLNPKDPSAHLKMAKMFVYIKEYTSAFNEINTVLRQDVYNPEGYFLKGMIYKDIKDSSKAISSFQTALQMDPKYKDAMTQLGLLYSEKKDPIALQYLDNAWKLDTSDAFPIFAKGVFYQNQKEYELAKEYYRNVITRDRQYADAYINMGYVLIQQDSFEKARRQYDLLTKTDPSNPEAYYNRGFCSELMGKKEEAIADYKQALVFDDKYPEALEGLKRMGQ